MDLAIRSFEMKDYDLVLGLWRSSEGLSLGESDSRENIQRYLQRNPGLSYTAWYRGRLAGAVLCGHDGRRGFLHHLAVVPEHRKQGVADRLIKRCLTGLANECILRCHVFVLHSNHDAREFWKKIGWKDRADIGLMTLDITLHSSCSEPQVTNWDS